MIYTNKDYASRIKERLVARDPEIYSQLSVIKIRVVINYFTKNIVTSVYKHRHASVKNFFNIYPNPGQLFEYRMSLLKHKSMKSLWKYFKELKEEQKIRIKKNEDKNIELYNSKN